MTSDNTRSDESAAELQIQQKRRLPFWWLARVRNLLFVCGLLAGLTAVIWQISGPIIEWQVYSFGFISALCIVGSGNAMIWRHLLAGRVYAVDGRQHRNRTIGLVALLAVASILVVAAIMWVYLAVFFAVMNSGILLWTPSG